MLSQDFQEFIQSPNDNQVRYLVVGGYAVALLIQLGYPPSRIDVISTLRPQDLADLENLQ